MAKQPPQPKGPKPEDPGPDEDHRRDDPDADTPPDDVNELAKWLLDRSTREGGSGT